jgi:hypothetical protein
MIFNIKIVEILHILRFLLNIKYNSLCRSINRLSLLAGLIFP